VALASDRDAEYNPPTTSALHVRRHPRLRPPDVGGVRRRRGSGGMDCSRRQIFIQNGDIGRTSSTSPCRHLTARMTTARQAGGDDLRLWTATTGRCSTTRSVEPRGRRVGYACQINLISVGSIIVYQTARPLLRAKPVRRVEQRPQGGLALGDRGASQMKDSTVSTNHGTAELSLVRPRARSTEASVRRHERARRQHPRQRSLRWALR
jgi:hypothetical protein